MNQKVPFLDLKAMNLEAQHAIEDAWRSVSSDCGFIGGKHVETFETQWAAYCDSRFCVGTSDGTAALELALRALKVGPGDDVLVPANTFVATWEAVVATGGRPVAVDVDPETLLVTASSLAEAMTANTVGMIVVHLFGQPVNMTEVMALARKRGVWVVEDAAQAHGAKWLDRTAGSIGDIGCFSFYPGKNLGAFGDAGAIVTASSAMADTIRSLANHGRQTGSTDRHDLIGNNRRLDGLQAAILSAKLAFLNGWNTQRRAAMGWYKQQLAGLPVRFVSTSGGAFSVHHLAVIEVENRDAVQRALAERGVGTGIHYRTPCHLQPAFQHLAQRPMPAAERAANRILSLPMFPHITEEQISDVASALKDVLGAARADNDKARFKHAAE